METHPRALTMTVADPEMVGRVLGERTGMHIGLRPREDYAENLARMSQTAEFDLCEMPLVTLLQAASVGLQVRALPIVMLRRTPHLCWAGRQTFPLATLADFSTGVRSYAQTTGVWVRAVLADQFGLASGDWVTTDRERYRSLPAPPSVRRIPHPHGAPGLLEDGLVQAIVAPSAGTGSLVPVLEDAAVRGREWFASAAVVPINHVLVCNATAADQRLDEVIEICGALRDHALADPTASPWGAGDEVIAGRPVAECFDRDEILRSADYLMPRAITQGILPEQVDLDALFVI